MGFSIDKKYINETEQELNVKFPEKFKNKMVEENGGMLESRNGEIWHLYPFFDKSNKKRIARTCNHIVLETNNAKQWDNFPNDAIAIAADGGGNHLVLLPNSLDNCNLGEEIYDWFHETGELTKIAETIMELLPQKKDVIKRKKSNKKEKVDSLKLSNFVINSIPLPWKAFNKGNDYFFQLGKKQEIRVKFLKETKIDIWTDDSYWQSRWEMITDLEVISEKELIYDEFEEFELVTFKTQSWIPVLTWIRKKNDNRWILIFHTESSRFRGDMIELKKLLRNVK